MTTVFEFAARLQDARAAEELLLILVKATLVLGIARLLLAAMPRASAAMKHLVATGALIGVAMMPLLSMVVPAWNIAVETIEAEQVASQVAAAPAAEGTARAKTIGVSDQESTFGTAIALAKATGVVPAEPLTAVQRAATIGRSTWKGMIVLSIAFAALAMLVHMIAGMLGVRFVARSAEPLQDPRVLRELDTVREQLALPFDVRLLRSSRISVPVLWGVARPVLLLPPDVVTWPEERLRVVLLHELAHLKRFDGMSLILTRISVSLFWFHPLAWSLERAARSECERACDDLVLAEGTKPSDYADHLLAIARSMPTFDPFRAVTLAMSRKSQLEGRLLSILQPGVARRVFSGRGVALACALAVAVIIPVSALRLIAEPAKEKQPEITELKTDSTITVKPQVEALGDYLLAQLGKYDERADRFASTPRDGKEWYERAYDLYRVERYSDAALAFREAADQGYAPAKSMYNAACSYALVGDADRAATAIQAAIAAGWDDTDAIANDSDFDPIRSDPRFARAVQDTTGEVATRRLTETLERYEKLRNNQPISEKDDDSLAEAIADGITGGLLSKHKEKEVHWFEVGGDLLRLRRFDEAIDAFERSIALGQKPGSAMYNIACAHSLRGDAATGMTLLEKAIENGFSGDEKLLNDPDIALLRQQPAFVSLRRKAAELEMRGCCDDDDDGKHKKGSNAARTWGEAAAYHRNVVDKYPDSGRAWFNLGFTALQAHDYPTAIDAWNRALALGYRAGTTSYNLACTYARQGNRDAAFTWLARAKAAKFELEQYVNDDEDLESLRDDPRWDRLVADLDIQEKHLFWEKKKHKRSK